MNNKVRIAVFVSGGGTNFQAIINACKSGIITSGEIVLAVSSSYSAYAIERAKAEEIPCVVCSRKELGSQENFEAAIINALNDYKVDLIVLAGFMSILSADFTSRYDHRIINIHPSLIPSFCGEGFYGLRVHEAALSKGVKVSGATVHFVNEIPDGGEIIMQKAVDVLPGDTPKILQKRIMENAEWIIFPQAVELVSQNILKGAY